MKKKYIAIGSSCICAALLITTIIIHAASDKEDIEPAPGAEVVINTGLSGTTTETSEETTTQSETESADTTEAISEAPVETPEPEATPLTTRVILPMKKLPPSVTLETLPTLNMLELNKPIVELTEQFAATTSIPEETHSNTAESTSDTSTSSQSTHITSVQDSSDSSHSTHSSEESESKTEDSSK